MVSRSLLCLFVWLLAATQVAGEIIPGELELVNSTRVSRFDYQYEFKLPIKNTGSDIINVAAAVTSNNTMTRIVEGNLTFGNVSANSEASSSNTLVILHNRRSAFSQDNLNFEFSFGEPGATGPVVEITSPESLLTVGTSTLEVNGQVAPTSALLTINGVAVNHTGGSFNASVSLQEGHNTIVARAVSGSQQVTDSISVSLDLTPPYVTIESHEEGQSVFTDTVTVTGLVNDIVRGTIESEQANVTVNGIPAEISNRSYAAHNVPLVEGSNLITVAASDQVGNIGNTQVTISYEVPAGKRIELVSGQNQSATINTTLSNPLVVRVLDDSLQPVANASVVFRVIQGSGIVGVGSDAEGRAVVVTTDANGQAGTFFQVGSRSGSANQKVRARVVGYESEVIFDADALGEIGNKLSVNSGNNQRGVVGQVLPAPLVSVVTDSGPNVVAGARVRYEATVGGGTFGNEQSSIEVVTDSDGRATVPFVLGDLEGVDAQRITATLVDAPVLNGKTQVITAGFSATAFVPADPGLTSISGVVLDNQDNPVPGVTVRVDGSTRQAVTDEQGRFLITEAPIGPVHLIADGSTATVDGEFPSLAYNLVTVSGVENPLSAPIYMVKLNTENSVFVGNGDVELTLEEYPGFKLEIAAGSVTFPDGSNEGEVSVTPVNASAVPMAPPNGMQPQFIVTIQPTGTLFDPPARLTLPNFDGHAPGAQAEMYSFDHDLEEFVVIGLGTVSEDGSEIRSNPGVGVVKAGWHCGSQPSGSGCTHNCGECQKCTGECNCVDDDSKTPTSITDTKGDCKKPACIGGSASNINDDLDKPSDVCKSCLDGDVVSGRLNISGLPTKICETETVSINVFVTPESAFPNENIEFDSNAPGVLNVSSQLSFSKSGNKTYTMSGNYPFVDPGEVKISFGEGCDESTHSVHVLPTSVVGLSGIYGVLDRFQELEFLKTECTAYPKQNKALDFEVDGCSNSPDSLESNLIETRYGTNFDLYKSEPVWGSVRGNIPYEQKDSVVLACNKHDICYQSCGKTQSQCDEALEQDMTSTCRTSYSNPCPHNTNEDCLEYAEELADCEDAADFYFSVLTNVGALAYTERQTQRCLCCE